MYSKQQLAIILFSLQLQYDALTNVYQEEPICELINTIHNEIETITKGEFWA